MIIGYKAYLVRTTEILSFTKKILHLNFQDAGLNFVDFQQTQPVANTQSKLENRYPTQSSPASRFRHWKARDGFKIEKINMDKR